MPIGKFVEYEDASAEIRAVYDDIMETRGVRLDQQFPEGAGAGPGDPEAHLGEHQTGHGAGPVDAAPIHVRRPKRPLQIRPRSKGRSLEFQ